MRSALRDECNHSGLGTSYIQFSVELMLKRAERLIQSPRKGETMKMRMLLSVILGVVMLSVLSSNLYAQGAKGEAAPSGPYWAKQVEVVGIYVYATNTVSDVNLLHAAGVLAQYSDNDEDGKADNPKIMKALIDRKGAITMRGTQGERPSGPRPHGQGLYDDETRPNARANGEFDGAWEEILHMVTDNGWGGAYPEVFGRVPGTDQSNAMDLARGGQFIEIPSEYPEGAWYTYGDESCTYDCMNSEYIYWSFTTFLGLQDYPGRSGEIGQEWRPTTKKELKERDPAIFAILSRPEYKLPKVKPDGDYDGTQLKIEPYKP